MEDEDDTRALLSSFVTVGMDAGGGQFGFFAGAEEANFMRFFIHDEGIIEEIYYPLEEYLRFYFEVASSFIIRVDNLCYACAQATELMELNLEVIRAKIIAELPTHARWLIYGAPLDYDFSVAQRGLAPLPPNTTDCSDPEWMKAQAGLLIFGEYDYAEGGGAHPWLGIGQTDGRVYSLDVEETHPLCLLNTSIEQFIATFTLLSRFFGAGEPLPPDIDVTLCALDLQYPVSDWRMWVEALKGGEY